MPDSPPEHPINKTRRIMFAFVVMPTLAGIAWWKALQFDPYAMSFLTKTNIAPSPDMPNELRIAGLVFIVIALIPAWAGVQSVRKRIGKRVDALMLGWVAVLVAAFGGAFFVAADAAQTRIEQETSNETRPD